MDTNDQQRVVFDEDRMRSSMSRPIQQQSKMVSWMLNNFGAFVKTEEQANYALTGIALFIFIISLFLFFRGGSDAPSMTTEEAKQKMMQTMPR